jgi:hypothetical protein
LHDGPTVRLRARPHDPRHPGGGRGSVVADRLEVDIAILHLGAVRFPITVPVR